MDQNRLKSLLGLATKAGRTLGGQDTVLQGIRDGKASVVIVSTEASDRTKKTFKDKCTYYNVPYIEICSRDELGKYLGRMSCTVAAVADKGFGKEITEMFFGEEN